MNYRALLLLIISFFISFDYCDNAASSSTNDPYKKKLTKNREDENNKISKTSTVNQEGSCTLKKKQIKKDFLRDKKCEVGRKIAIKGESEKRNTIREEIGKIKAANEEVEKKKPIAEDIEKRKVIKEDISKKRVIKEDTEKRKAVKEDIEIRKAIKEDIESRKLLKEEIERLKEALDWYERHDYYDVLEVDVTASVDEVRKSRKAKNVMFHPDKRQNPIIRGLATKIVQIINSAGSVLEDDEKRKEYDEEMDIHSRDPVIQKNPYFTKKIKLKRMHSNPISIKCKQRGSEKTMSQELKDRNAVDLIMFYADEEEEYLTILGYSKNYAATVEDVEEAFKKKASQVNPQVNKHPNAAEAYEIAKYARHALTNDPALLARCNERKAKVRSKVETTTAQVLYTPLSTLTEEIAKTRKRESASNAQLRNKSKGGSTSRRRNIKNGGKEFLNFFPGARIKGFESGSSDDEQHKAPSGCFPCCK